MVCGSPLNPRPADRTRIGGKITGQDDRQAPANASRAGSCPDPSDRIAYGRYVVQGKAQCFDCHSADFAKLDEMRPQRSKGYMGGGNKLVDMAGVPVYSANLTRYGRTGIGRWSEDEFVRAVRFEPRCFRSGTSPTPKCVRRTPIFEQCPPFTTGWRRCRPGLSSCRRTPRRRCGRGLPITSSTCAGDATARLHGSVMRIAQEGF